MRLGRRGDIVLFLVLILVSIIIFFVLVVDIVIVDLIIVFNIDFCGMRHREHGRKCRSGLWQRLPHEHAICRIGASALSEHAGSGKQQSCFTLALYSFGNIRSAYLNQTFRGIEQKPRDLCGGFPLLHTFDRLRIFIVAEVSQFLYGHIR